ncbi:AFL003Cp [Eremothecium gossypii ATCC 10895]|uniref:AFL003Cp n=1 Tax=Eremothecium gossypii (strain ATCC 10895 / CBS 109.51 / FGSC 9923 / NRRL Y-1056) TaxID=284811 RepID=Q754S4_EREGS|nr:AFL003Cp [Eremothecium gossypii ATCC 10895]AAS53369.1 AFL003Cp [Eremothecium gossypii ATCC 10895]AEY97680.1 FAFL003Cp [Eremothecium gossypii FDAG1]
MRFALILFATGLVQCALGISLHWGHKDVSPDTKNYEIASVIWDRLERLNSSSLTKEQVLFIKTAAIVGSLSPKEISQHSFPWQTATSHNIKENSKRLKEQIGQGLSLAYLNVKDMADIEYLKEQVYQMEMMWDELTGIIHHALKVTIRNRHKELNWLVNTYLKFYIFSAEKINKKLAVDKGEPKKMVGSLMSIQLEAHKLMNQYIKMLQRKKTNVEEKPQWRSFDSPQPLPESEPMQVEKLDLDHLAKDVPLDKDNTLALLLKFKVLSAYQIFPTVPFCAVANIIFVAGNLCGKLFAGVTSRQAEILRELSKRMA